MITIATGATNVDIVGDVTASTVNADGDTAAGDNATMGYTSSEGLILTGQGSTNDVTIKNDADADVITIATGGTNVAIAGDLTISGDDLFMATNTSGAALIADGTNFNPVVISGDATIATNGALTIADNAVSLAKMAGGTDGNIISYDASGNPVAVATGNDGQVLTSQGAGAVCVFEDAAAGGAWTLISTDLASDDASIDVTGLDNTYATYVVVHEAMIPATDDVIPYMRLGDSSGFDSASNDYDWSCRGGYVSGAGFIQLGANASATEMRCTPIASGTDKVGNAAGEAFNAVFYIHRGLASAEYIFIQGQWSYTSAQPAHLYGIFGGTRTAVITLDRYQFFFSSGNVTSGRTSLYGVSHA